MRIRLAIPLLLTLLVGLASAQNAPSLNVGDPAPAFKPEAWLKGKPVAKFEKGKVYVVEFWATWCGPCIDSMPHLSDMADKLKGKAEFVSVNVWDRDMPGEKEPANAKHRERVGKFVKENDAKMRYNIALDDSSDTLSKNWLFAAGRNGIPCSFIVDQKGIVVWVGHPMEMEKPLEQVIAKKFDMAAAKAQQAKEREQAAAYKKITDDIAEAAKAGDMAKFEEMLAKAPGGTQNVRMGAGLAMGVNPEFALKYIELKINKTEGMEPQDWCGTLGYLASASKVQATKDRAVALSAECVELTKPAMKAVAYVYHARALINASHKDQAGPFLDKASEALKTFEPASGREGLGKFIESVRGSMSG